MQLLPWVQITAPLGPLTFPESLACKLDMPAGQPHLWDWLAFYMPSNPTWGGFWQLYTGNSFHWGEVLSKNFPHVLGISIPCRHSRHHVFSSRPFYILQIYLLQTTLGNPALSFHVPLFPSTRKQSSNVVHAVNSKSCTFFTLLYHTSLPYFTILSNRILCFNRKRFCFPIPDI